MIDRLVRGLATASSLTAEEILDVLWLSAIHSSAQAAGQAHAGSEPDTSLPQDNSGSQTGDSPVNSSPRSAPRGGNDAGIPLRLGGGRSGSSAGEVVSATEVGFGSPPPIRDALAMPRALRRLRQVRAPSRYLTVDVDATVEKTAEAGGRLMPVFGRPLERGLDLVLVVDESASMRIWGSTFEEFEQLLVQTGAFRSVSRLKLIVRDGAVVVEDPSGTLHPPRRIVDPSGKRVIFVATDASSEAWYTREPWDTIAAWCGAMPVALIQVLPQDYWARTALGEPYITTRALRPASPNSEYARRLAWWAHDPGGNPMPVVTLAPEALETWAQAAVSGTTWVTGITAMPPDPEYAPSASFAEADAETLVNDFLSRASPGAERLARVLASAPALSIPLILVLQESLLPETGVAELAEILSGSLLENTSGAEGQQLFRFRQGTREILQRGVTTFEEWDTYSAVSSYLQEHHLLGGPLQVRLPDPDGTSSLDQTEDPISELHETLVARLGLRAIPARQSFPEGEPTPALGATDPPMAEPAATLTPDLTGYGVSADDVPIADRHTPTATGGRPPLHDYSRSRAVLIGTSDYEFLAPVPAAENSLRRMRDLLTDPLCGWPADRVLVLANQSGPSDVPDMLITAFEDIRDVALFYFVGYGQISPDDQLCLGLARSRAEPTRRATTSLRYADVRRALQYSRAATKIVILDCVFAGRAMTADLGSSSAERTTNRTPGNSAADPADTGALDDPSPVTNLTRGTGAYTIAAASAWVRDTQGLTKPQTHFTKCLADLIERGIPGQPSRLRLDQVFEQLREDLAADQLPVPGSSGDSSGAREFVFAYNAAAPVPAHDQDRQRQPEAEGGPAKVQTTAPLDHSPSGTKELELPDEIWGFGSWLLWMIATRATGLVDRVYESGLVRPSRQYGSVDGHAVPTPSLVAWLLLAAERGLPSDALPQNDPELEQRHHVLRAQVSRALSGEPHIFMDSWLRELAVACEFSAADLEFLLASRDDRARGSEDSEEPHAKLREAIAHSLRSSPQPGLTTPTPSAEARAVRDDPRGQQYFMVQLEPGGFQPGRYITTVWSQRPGDYPVTLLADDQAQPILNIPRIIEQALYSLQNQTSTDKLSIEFILPNDMLSYPIDEWSFNGHALGMTYPVAVRSLDRIQATLASASRERWQRSWQALQERMPIDVYFVSAKSEDYLSDLALNDRHLGSIALMDFTLDRDAAHGFGGAGTKLPTGRNVLQQLVKWGVPAIIWPRLDDDTQRMRRLSELIRSATDVNLVPMIVHEFRRADAMDARGASGIGLLWDDAERIPDDPGMFQTPL
jgi:hypothetical protein